MSTNDIYSGTDINNGRKIDSKLEKGFGYISLARDFAGVKGK